MGIDGRWQNPRWKELLTRVDRLKVYALQQGMEEDGLQLDADATELLRAVPALLKEALRLEPISALQETMQTATHFREEVERIGAAVAALAGDVKRLPKRAAKRRKRRWPRPGAKRRGK